MFISFVGCKSTKKKSEISKFYDKYLAFKALILY